MSYITSLTNYEIIAIHRSLSNVLEKEMEIDLWNRLWKIVFVIEDTNNEYEKLKDKLLLKYIVKDDDGKPVLSDNKPHFLSDDDKQNYKEKLSELLKQKVDLSFSTNVDFKEILEEKIKINGKDLINIKSFLDSISEN